MDRESDESSVVTKLLVNGMIGGEEKSYLYKIKGCESLNISTSISGGGNIDFENAKFFMFKHPLHHYAITETLFCIYMNNLYWYNGEKWIRIETDDAINIDGKNILYQGDGLYFSGDIPAIYKHLDFDMEVGNGYFNNNNSFVGFYLSRANIQNIVLNTNNINIINIDADGKYLVENIPHYILFLYMDDKGQVSIPKANSSYKIHYTGEGSNFISVIRLKLNLNDFNWRIRGLYCFGSVEYKEEYKKRKRKITGVYDTEFYEKDWRFLKYIDINEPLIIYRVNAVASDDNTFNYKLTDDINGHFPTGVLNNRFWVRYKKFDQDEWTYSRIKGNLLVSGNPSDEFIIIENEDLVTNEKYIVQVCSVWQSKSETGAYAEGYIDVKSTTDLTGKYIQIGDVTLNEGTHWYKKSNTLLTAISIMLSIYINCSDVVPEDMDNIGGDDYRIYIHSREKGSIYNTITLSTNAPSGSIELSGSTLVNGEDPGEDDNIKEISILWRYDGLNTGYESYTEFGDSIEDIIPYSLLNEREPEYKLTAIQNNRQFYIGDVDGDNIIRWSEYENYQVTPMVNRVELNTYPGERCMGCIPMIDRLFLLYEKSAHVLRTQTEPFTYDGETDRFETTCISGKILQKNNLPVWLSVDGIKMYTGNNVISLTEKNLRKDYIGIISSEYQNKMNYDSICAIYSPKYDLAIWSFPNSTYSISISGGDTLTARVLCFDFKRGGFFFMETEHIFIDFYLGEDGTIYGVTSNGIVKLFSDNYDEDIRFIWQTGWLQINNCFLEKIQLNYKGSTAIIDIYADRNEYPSYGMTVSESSVYNLFKDYTMISGNEFKFEIKTNEDNNDFEFTKIETYEKVGLYK